MPKSCSILDQAENDGCYLLYESGQYLLSCGVEEMVTKLLPLPGGYDCNRPGIFRPLEEQTRNCTCSISFLFSLPASLYLIRRKMRGLVLFLIVYVVLASANNGNGNGNGGGGGGGGGGTTTCPTYASIFCKCYINSGQLIQESLEP